MVNTELLVTYIQDSGLKKQYIAKEMGINYNTLKRKIYNKSAFDVDQVQNLCKILHITNKKKIHEIFFN